MSRYKGWENMTTASLTNYLQRQRPAAPALPSVAEFFPTLQQLAKSSGWLGLHTYNALGEDSGLQVMLVRPGDALIMADIKDEGRTLTPSQAGWQAALDRATGIETYIWHPSELAAIEARLRRGA